MDNDKLILRKEGAVARIVLNNPARLNAISVEMWDSLDRILDDVGDDRAIRVRLHTPASLSSSSRRRQGSMPHGHGLRMPISSSGAICCFFVHRTVGGQISAGNAISMAEVSLQKKQRQPAVPFVVELAPPALCIL